jgi:hypothetical protein
MPMQLAPIHMSLEEVNVLTGQEVVMEFVGNILLIVSDLRGILDQQLRPYTIML